MGQRLYTPAALVLLGYVAAFGVFGVRYGWGALALVHVAASWFAHPLRIRQIMADIARAGPETTTTELARLRAAWSRAGNRLGLAILPGGLVAIALVVALRALGAKFPHDRDTGDFHVGSPFLFGAIIVTAISLPWLIYAQKRFKSGLGAEAISACLGLGVVAGFVAAFWNLPVFVLTTGFIPGKVAEAFGISATAGMVEEAAKLAALAFIAVPQLTRHHQRDAPLLGLLVGLAFGMAENLQYAGSDHALLTGLGRAATAVPSHGMGGLIMGWLLARAMAAPRHRARGLVLAWAWPALLHFAYDLPLFLADIDAYQTPALWCFTAVNLVQCVWGLTILLQLDQGAARPTGGRATGLVLWLLVPALALAFWLSPANPEDTPITRFDLAALLLAAASHPALMGGEIFWRSMRRSPAVQMID